MEVTALQALWDAAHPAIDDYGRPLTPIPSDAELLSYSATRGYWKNITSGPDTYEVVNVCHTAADIEAFRLAHAVDILAIYSWSQIDRLDSLESQDADSNVIGFPTIPQGVLDLMKDYVVFDGNGNPVGTTPATFDTPNWGHVFANSSPGKQRIFAGAFTNAFSGDFK